MNQQERAEEHLRIIRRLMERGAIYRAISAPTALVGGLLSLAASGLWLATTRPDSDPHYSFLLLWLPVLLLTAGANTLFIILGAKKRNEPLFSASMKAAFTALAPSFLTAGVLTLLFTVAASDPLNQATLGITWAICYGLGLLATGHFAPRSLTLLGWAFLLSGLAAVVVVRFASDSLFRMLDARNTVLFMAATFGLYHLIYALCAWPRNGAEPEP
jgi:hypothetical protein